MTENESENIGAIQHYFQWLFEGNPLIVALKLVWTGMLLVSVLFMKFIAAAVILGIGIAVWFILNDYENWYIKR